MSRWLVNRSRPRLVYRIRTRWTVGGGGGPSGVRLATSYVVQVVHRVVQQVARQGVDREDRAITAPAGAGPVGDLREAGGQPLGGRWDLLRDGCRVLLGVLVLYGGLVLVPVGEQRVVLGEHPHQPLVEQDEDVADVARVLQRRPDVGVRPIVYVGALEHLDPAGGIGADAA